MRFPSPLAASRESLLMSVEAIPTILVVDEEPQLLRLIRVILDREGYQVLPARSIREAVRICEHHPGPIHLVLIDILIPEAQNPELVARLTARPGMKTIAMSDAGPEGWPGPLAGYLAKPFSPDGLRRAVGAALGLADRAAFQ
jgi:CheY-like chemotaxis protein